MLHVAGASISVIYIDGRDRTLFQNFSSRKTGGWWFCLRVWRCV